MNNWESCLNPTYPWRSAMSIPRELKLRRIDGKLRLCQQPVRELQQLRDKMVEVKDRKLTSESLSLDFQGQQFEIVLEIQPESATEFGIRVLKGNEEQTVVGYNTKSGSMYVDRTKSGNVSFHPAFAVSTRDRSNLMPKATYGCKSWSMPRLLKCLEIAARP